MKIALAGAVLAAMLVIAPTGLGAGAAGHSRAAVVTLNGTVGPGFTITLKKGGKQVRALPAGTYRLVIADRSNIHDFKLEKSGGSIEKRITTVPFVGSKAVTMTLTAGKWEFYCEPHQATMKGEFTVT